MVPLPPPEIGAQRPAVELGAAARDGNFIRHRPLSRASDRHLRIGTRMGMGKLP
jgi:hypothetical protein